MMHSAAIGGPKASNSKVPGQTRAVFEGPQNWLIRNSKSCQLRWDLGPLPAIYLIYQFYAIASHLLIS
jgi:hypothetical protein